MLLALALKTSFLDPGLCNAVHLLEKLGSAPGNSEAFLALKRRLEGSLSVYSVYDSPAQAPFFF